MIELLGGGDDMVGEEVVAEKKGEPKEQEKIKKKY